MAVERINGLNDPRVKPQTIQHHLKRYQFAVKATRKYALDFACGSGYGTNMLAEAGYHAIGIDISKETLQKASAKYQHVQFYCGSLTSEKVWSEIYSKWNNKIDLITFFEAIEHFSKTEGQKIVELAFCCLKPNGVFIVSTPRKANKKYNKFHKSEWIYKELELLLKKYFSGVLSYSQTWEDGQIDPKGTENKKEDFYIFLCVK